MEVKNVKPWMDLEVLDAKTQEQLVDLEPETFIARATELALQERRVEALKIEHKQEKARLKEEMEIAIEERGRLARVVSRRRELRPVLCESRACYATGTVYIVRTDTEDLVTSRRMTDDEKQVALCAIAGGAIPFQKRKEERNAEVEAKLRSAERAVQEGRSSDARELLIELLESHANDDRVQILRRRLASLGQRVPNVEEEIDEEAADMMPPEPAD